jgi:hypothetical protein
VGESRGNFGNFGVLSRMGGHRFANKLLLPTTVATSIAPKYSECLMTALYNIQITVFMAVQSGRLAATFQKNLLCFFTPTETMEVVDSSETAVPYQITHCQNTEDHALIFTAKNLKYCLFLAWEKIKTGHKLSHSALHT